MLLEPQNTFGVEVVGWFVEKQQIGLFEEKLAECDASLFSTRQHCDGRVRWRTPQCVHRLLEL